jgi:hypothetical protein
VMRRRIIKERIRLLRESSREFEENLQEYRRERSHRGNGAPKGKDES